MGSLGTIVGAVAAILVGGAVAAVTAVSLVNAQTGPSTDISPADVTQPVVEYGSTD